MKSARASLLWFLAMIFAVLALSGCESDHASSNASTQVPWSRPASWEGGIPGMMGTSQGR